MDNNYHIGRERNTCYDEIHEAFRAIKEVNMEMFDGKDEERTLKVSNGKDKMLLNSEDGKIKLLSKKFMEVIKDNEGDELRNM
jgi:hypothetical protein